MKKTLDNKLGRFTEIKPIMLETKHLNLLLNAT